MNVSDPSCEVEGAPGSTALCLFDCDCPDAVASMIEGLSPEVSARLSEVLVVHESAVAWPGDQESAPRERVRGPHQISSQPTRL